MATYTRAYFPQQPQHKFNRQIVYYEQMVNYGGDYPARQVVNAAGDVMDQEKLLD
jgi:hypothetical protein